MLRFARFFVAMLVIAAPFSAAHAQDLTDPISTAKGYDVHYYKATVWLNRVTDSIAGQVEMTATSMGDLPQILQHAKYLTIDSIFVDGVRSAMSITDSASGTYTISEYPANYHNGSLFTVRTFYHGKGTNEGGSNAWGGVQNKGGMMFAMGVGFGVPYVSCTRHWMPCYDEPDDKADSVLLRFFADTSGIVVSNGLQTGYTVGNDGRSTFCEWTISHPIATYLLTFAYGPFQHLSIANPLNIPFDVYAFAKDTAKVRALMEKSVVKGLVFFDSLYAPYPFEKVGYVIAPIGSMEHQTMVTLVSQVFDTNNTTAVHELSHQWWGDRVTCYDFNDPWLNEGFATFSESLFQERFSGQAQYWKNQHAHIASSIGTTIPLYGAPSYTKPRNNYPPLIYDKGAAVLGMLRYFFGDSIFFTAIRGYGNVAKYSTSTSTDLQIAFEMTAKQNVSWFFNKWVFGIGNPFLNILWSRSGNTVNLRLEQTQDSVKIGFFRLPLVIEARTYSGKSERHTILMDSLHINQISFANSFVPDSLVVDPDGAVIKKINGTVKLGVIAQAQNSDGKMAMFQFNPNPSNKKMITMMMSAAMQGKNLETAELMIFDTNGNNVSSVKLGLLQAGNAPGGSLTYQVDISALPGGTYFATLLLNGTTIGGRGNFVVTK